MTRKYLEKNRESFLKSKKESLINRSLQLLPEPKEHVQKFKKLKIGPPEKHRKSALSKSLVGNFKARFINMSVAQKNSTIDIIEQIYNCFLQSVSSNHVDQVKLSNDLNIEKNRKFPSNSSMWTNEAINCPRFELFARLSLICIKHFCKFIANTTVFREFPSDVRMHLIRSSCFNGIILRAAFDYSISDESIVFINGFSYNKSDYLSVGYPLYIVEKLFDTCRKVKRYLKEDARLFCLLSLSLVLNNKSVENFIPEATCMIEKARKLIDMAMEFYCHSQRKFFDGAHLICALGDIMVATHLMESYNDTVFHGNSSLSKNIPDFIQLYKTWLEDN